MMGRVIGINEIELVYPTCYGCLAPPPPGKEPLVTPPTPSPDTTSGGDICILIDVTDPMQPMLTALEQQLKVQAVQWAAMGTRLAIITYKSTTTFPFLLLPFTSSLAGMLATIDAIMLMIYSGEIVDTGEGGPPRVADAVYTAPLLANWGPTGIRKRMVLIGSRKGEPVEGSTIYNTVALAVARAEAHGIEVSAIAVAETTGVEHDEAYDYFGTLLTTNGYRQKIIYNSLVPALFAVDAGATFESLLVSYEGYAQTSELLTGNLRRVNFSGTHVLSRMVSGVWAPPVDNFSFTSPISVQPSFQWQASGTGTAEHTPNTPEYSIESLSRVDAFNVTLFNGTLDFHIMLPVAEDFVLSLVSSASIAFTQGVGTFGIEASSEDSPTGHESFGELKGTLTMGHE